ncbi:hypothetical protein DL95DRAFT_526574 [Leptodontidium sp. 2 PMI_412]|nr:hypothetical protein DL95DRAFT_526574 [Leptodontidium sp. 2 PMI_412]
MESYPPPNPKKRRIPKACAACRSSKVRCDGGKPCIRCRNANTHCDYVKPVEDQMAEKLAQIETQVNQLNSRIPDANTAVALFQLRQQTQQLQSRDSDFTPPYSASEYQVQHQSQQEPQTASPVSMASGHHSLPNSQINIPFHPEYINGSVAGSGVQMYSGLAGTKRKCRDFELNTDTPLDVVGKEIISFDDAVVYFRTFFQGCDKYVPVFDPIFDTFASVRSRSSMLFDTICAVGCRAEHGPTSPQYQILSNTTKGPISSVMIGTTPPSIEVIQALLVDASYSEKGWLLTSLALKMALEIGLADAYSQLCARILESDANDCGDLFRKARVWFGVFVLENILSIDCGKKPGIKASEGMRRCRVLLGHPAITTLDFRLLAQVEVSVPPFPNCGGNDTDRDVVEFDSSDWINLVESRVRNESDTASLLINLKIQRDWSEMTMLCKGLQGIGIDNLAIMSDEQRNLIHLAKSSAQRHLSTILSSPKLYLGALRYGMDFVWAKCAFSVLLLLKLARLIPESTNMSELIIDAKTLLRELSQIQGSNNIYFRILSLSVEKCEKALKGDFPQSDSRGTQTSGIDGLDAEMDFQSYVPKEFILEWNFPGLTFCWIPFDFGELFMDFGAGF